MLQLPKEYTERMKKLLGDGYDAYLASLAEPPVRAFRVNTEKISLSEFERINVFSDKRVPYTANGFYLDYESIGTHPYHHAGMIYVQEPAAMAPAECIDISPDWTVLDLCAAPGGKSSQIRNKLGEKGVLVSNEIISSRCRILTGNIERLGLPDTVTTCMDSEKLAKIFPKSFDMIMVDAPCSGEGMLRKESAALTEWSLDNVNMCAQRQRNILDNAVKALKNGGYIVYSTCTFSLEENEMTVDTFLAAHPEFELIPVTERVFKYTEPGVSFEGCRTENIHYCRRFYPHKMPGEGQFMAVLHNTLPRDDENEAFQKAYQKPKIDRVITDFLTDTLSSFDASHLKVYNGNPVIFSSSFTVPDRVAFSCGITVGEVRKGYILPHHQFFMGMGKHFKRRIELPLDSDELKAYLRGEEIPTDCENGWAVVTVNGCAVGGAKAVNGTAKNHYPKGLRNKQ